jgi:hypothetical protein
MREIFSQKYTSRTLVQQIKKTFEKIYLGFILRTAGFMNSNGERQKRSFEIENLVLQQVSAGACAKKNTVYF